MSLISVLCVFLHIFIIAEVHAKAVSKEPKQVTFQGFDNSPIRLIQGSTKVVNQVAGYTPLIDGKPIIVPPTVNDEKYDLSYHENLDRVINSYYPDPKSQVKNKKSQSGTRHRKLKDPPSRKHKVDAFLEDQVFIERTENLKKPNKVPALDLNKPHVGDTHPTDVSCSKSATRITLTAEHKVEKDRPNIPNSVSQSNNREAEDRRKREETNKSNDLSSGTTIGDETSMNIPIEVTDEDSIEDFLNTNDSSNELIEVKSSATKESEKETKNKLNESSLTQPDSHFEVAEKNQDIDTQLSENRTSIASEDEQLMKYEATDLFDVNFKSFVFNPQAQPQEKFQECTTRKNETGHCRYVQHCMLPSVLSSISQFMNNVCIIEERFVGVCCPEFPVSTLQVKWPIMLSNSSHQDGFIETPQDCGIGANTRIIGGSDANRKAWPWMVALLNNKHKFYCGGALINTRYVLTASHCTFGTSSNQIVARLGEYDFNDSRDPHDDYLVTEIKRHGQYARLNLRNDIALLKLEKPVVFNERVKTVCLPKVDNDYLGKEATLVGWGHLNALSTKSEVLQEASFPIIKNIECAQMHGLPVPSSLICAAAPSKDKGACNGDSGGPLMLLDEDDRWKVIGIVSWGRRGCSPRFPTVYTRVTHFLDWIEKHAI